MAHWRAHHSRDDVQMLTVGSAEARRYYRLEQLGPASWLLTTFGPSITRVDVDRPFSSERSAKAWVASRQPGVAIAAAGGAPLAHVLRMGDSPSGPGAA